MNQERFSEKGLVKKIIKLTSNGFVIAETTQGEIIKLAGDSHKKAARSFPEGVIESLFPVFQRTLSNFPQLTPSENTYWDELKENARYSEEEAVNLLRRHGDSVEDTTVETMNRLLRLSGKDPKYIDQGLKQTVYDFLEKDIHQLYLETTEVRP